MSRKILCILSEWGFWGEELVGPLDAFDKQGYEVVFATGTGKRPVPLPPSEDPTFVDPPLGRTVTSEENARKTREMNREKVESIDVDQSVTGRIFGYGTIIVRGTGGSLEPMRRIADPLTFRSHITAAD